MRDAGTRKLLGQEARERFRKFEMLVVTVGSVAILASALASYSNYRSMLEFAGQLLMLMVFLVSMRHGRSGAVVSAITATVIYAAARWGELGDPSRFLEVLQLVGFRALGYFVVGLIGGEAMAALKYYLARGRDGGGVDPESGVYVEEFIKDMIEREIRNFERYRSSFSIVSIELIPEVLSKSRSFRTDTSGRGIGSLLKRAVRIVDEVGRLGDYRYALLLPHTSLAGAHVVAGRVVCAIAGHYGVPPTTGILARVYSAPYHVDELKEFVGLPEMVVD